METDRMFWVDIESTGLTPASDQILEVGFVITDPKGTVQDYENWIVRPVNSSALTFMHDVVRKMHKESGLLLQIEEPYAMFLDEAERAIVTWLVEHDVGNGVYPLAGSSVGFDRSFLEAHLPYVHKNFHYRNIDVSSTNELMRMHAPDLYKKVPEKRDIHRVLPDLSDSLDLYRFQLQSGFIGNPEIGKVAAFKRKGLEK